MRHFVICTAFVLLFFGMKQIGSSAATMDLLPIVDGDIQDVGPEVGSPRDGIPDYVSGDSSVPVIRNPLIETQGIIEFSLGAIAPNSIQSATLEVVPIGAGIPPGTLFMPVQLFGFAGDGALQLDDFNVGSFITSFDVPTAPFVTDPILIDVTEFLQNQQGFAGFNLRLDPTGPAGQVNFGSLEIEPSATLTIVTDDPPSTGGKIVVNNDEWTLSNAGFSQSPDAATFILNVARFFAGETGSLHAFSNNFSYTQSSLIATLTEAGFTYTTGTDISFDLQTLLGFDGVFLGGDLLNPMQIATLIDYINNGGNVYIAAGTSSGRPDLVADTWNAFLNVFGLSFARANNGIVGNIDVTSCTHPIFAGVSTLYQASGQTITGVGTEICPDIQGLYAVVDTAPTLGTITIMTTADPADGLDFSFTGSNGLGDFFLDNAVPDDNDTIADSITFTDLPTGDYTVTEVIPIGWKLDSVVCDDGNVNFLDNGVSIHLDTGEQIVCTFMNMIENQSPHATCQDVELATDPGVCTASPTPNVLAEKVGAESSDPDDDPIDLSILPAGPYNLGDNAITLTAKDDKGAFDSCTATVTVIDQEPPAIVCPTSQVVECTGPEGASASFAATATDNCSTNLSTSCDIASNSIFLPGSTAVSCSATDASGNSNECDFTVTVQDKTAPVISSVSTNPNTLWPLNHKMVSVTVAATVSDTCDAAPLCKITKVASNESTNDKGNGNTAPDWVIADDLIVNLRAERSGTGNGREYMITVACTDASGNSSTKAAVVTVPHDRRNQEMAQKRGKK